MKRLINWGLRHNVEATSQYQQIHQPVGKSGANTARVPSARRRGKAARHPVRLVLGVSMAALVSLSAAAAEEKAFEPYIVNGLNTQQHPSTAALLYNQAGVTDYPIQVRRVCARRHVRGR